MNAEDLKTLAEMKVALIKFRLSKAQERWLIAHLEAEVREANKLRALASTYLEDCDKEQTRAEAAGARCAALEGRVRQMGKVAKTAAARTIAEWAIRDVMQIAQPTLAEVVMTAIDAALAAIAPGESQEKEE